MISFSKTALALTSSLMLASACKGVTDSEPAKSGPLIFEMKRNPHGGNGLGAGGQMTNDWTYPEPTAGEGHHGQPAHAPQGSHQSSEDAKPASGAHQGTAH
jgi:hypothetical protein